MHRIRGLGVAEGRISGPGHAKSLSRLSECPVTANASNREVWAVLLRNREEAEIFQMFWPDN